MADDKAAAAAKAKDAKKKKLPKGRHRSAIKRHRQSVKKAELNQTIFSSIKTAVKKVRTAVSAKDKPQAETALRSVMSLLHRAGRKGIIHKKNADRHISRLSSFIAKLG
jgi:small subunit ribosomal protein S20